MSDSPPDSLLVIAGWGRYPWLLVEGARRAGVGRVDVLGFRGSADRGLRRVADRYEAIPFGSLSVFLRTVREAACQAVVMGGQIHPLSLFRARFDEAARDEMRRMPVRNAHTLFGRLSELIAHNGQTVLPASFFMSRHLPEAGVLTRRAPTDRERLDLQAGFDLALAVCNLDIGQTLVIKEGVVLAVEAFEGTNAAIRRGAKLGGPGATVIKVAKQGHDMRFDIPVIGLRTLRVLRRHRIATIGIQAGRVLLLDQRAVLAEADRLGLSIEAVESGLPHAPVCPPRDTASTPAEGPVGR